MIPGFAECPEVVLGPLRGRSDADWRRAPAGKWTPAQIVEHLALAFEMSVQGFRKRRTQGSMTRRPKTLIERIATGCVFGLGWIPPIEAPARARPQPNPDPEDVARRFYAGHAQLSDLARELLPLRATDLFLKHPRMGDLTLGEWLRFHAWHCDHHARQIRARLAG